MNGFIFYYESVIISIKYDTYMSMINVFKLSIPGLVYGEPHGVDLYC